MENYQVISLLGAGTYGTVYKAMQKKTGQIVALKVFKSNPNRLLSRSDMKETTILKRISRCNHPNIIYLLDVIVDDFKDIRIVLVLEHMDCDLKALIKEGTCVDPTVRMNVMRQISTGVEFLHANEIIHRDLKPRNILYKRSNQCIKIADFGLSKDVYSLDKLSRVVVTLWYRAPELMLCTRYNDKIDVWSIGCIFSEMIYNDAIFKGANETDQLVKIFNVIPLPTTQEWPVNSKLSLSCFNPIETTPLSCILKTENIYAYDLIDTMLSFNPNYRPSFSSVLSHKMFNFASV